nr:reverse transcriptase domain-containing protein [Tanacetum cinerariifolium]
MADQRTIAELLCAPNEGYAEAIVVPPILAEHFELKHHLVSKFINEFFPPSRTTNLRNEISNFQQQFDESFHRAWDRYKDLLRVCPLNQKTSDVTTAMTAILKQIQETPPPAFVEEICVTCSGDHPYYQCLTADGNTFLEFRDNIQGYVLATAVNYN